MWRKSSEFQGENIAINCPQRLERKNNGEITKKNTEYF